MAPKRVNLLSALSILFGALFIFIASDSKLAFLEDEATIVSAARRPAIETLRLWGHAQAEHEHPPLSDLLLHFWLPIAGPTPALLRLPSIVLYLAGVLIYASIARKMAGDAAFKATLWIGCLWPFGFHFGRLVGWYSFCFFLVACLTWAYLVYLDRPNRARWAVILLLAALLVYSNYYGWAIIGCLIIDAGLRRNQVQPLTFALLTLSVLALIYLPMWQVFAREIEVGSILTSGRTLASATLYAVYNLYSLFVNESIAPWFWWFSVPVSVAIVVSVILLLKLLPQQDRRFLAYFTLLFAGMAVLGIIGTKRLLFFSGWLLVPFAIAAASPRRGALRRALVFSMMFIGAMGWMGFFSKQYYSSQHFLEPWSSIADKATLFIKRGGLVLTNSPSLLFNLNYSMQRAGLTQSKLPGFVDDPRVVPIGRWQEGLESHASSVLFVKAVNISSVAEMPKVEAWLNSHCGSLSTVQLMPDTGYAMKSRLFSASGQLPFRISLQTYECRASSR